MADEPPRWCEKTELLTIDGATARARPRRKVGAHNTSRARRCDAIAFRGGRCCAPAPIETRARRTPPHARSLTRSTHVAGCRDYRLLDGDRVMADVLDIRRPEHTGVRACVRASTHERVGSHRAQIARYSARRCGAPSTALSTSRRVWLALHRLAPIHDSTNILSASPCVSPCIASRRRCN